MSTSTVPSKVPKKSAVKLIIVAALALFVAVSALPQYSAGWSWSNPPKLPQASRVALQALPEQGLQLSGWKTTDHISIELGGDNWSIQQLSADLASEDESAQASLKAQMTDIVLLLRPQVYGADQPEVEWLDIKGSQGWKTDSRQKITFDVSGGTSENDLKNTETVRINTDFFRAWNKDQTYAVLQWYAWPTGGSASPARWFWADQKVQWRHHQRMPWVAVSLWLPIEPLGEIESRSGLAESLGNRIQQTLMQSIFQETVTPASSGDSDEG